MMTKSQRILELYKTGKYTTRQIADVVDCRTEYVRVVARQRRGRSLSETDLRYIQKKHSGLSPRDAYLAHWREINARRSARKRRAEARAS